MQQYLSEIELPIWVDPQGNIIMEKCRDHCFLYFNCWLDNMPTEADYIGKITFQNAWAVTSLDVEFYDIRPKEEFKYRSSVFIVVHSVWLNEMLDKRSKYYDNWTGWKDKSYHHFHFPGHDNYFDIIAESYTVEKVPKSKAAYFERLWIG